MWESMAAAPKGRNSCRTQGTFIHLTPSILGSRAADDLILQVIIMDSYHLCSNIVFNPRDEKNYEHLKAKTAKNMHFFSIQFILWQKCQLYMSFLFSLGDSSTELLYSFAGTKIKVLLWLSCSFNTNLQYLTEKHQLFCS